MTDRLPGDDVLIGEHYYILASSVAADLPKLVLKHDDAFLVADRRGDFPNVPGEFGFYFADTRFLSLLELRLHGLRGIALSHRDWLAASVRRTQLRAQWRELFESFDAVICPIMPTPAYPHDHSPDQAQRRILIDGKAHAYTDQFAWPGIATLPGLPSTAIPTGFAPDGLPVGVQIVGPWLEDRTPLKLAELIEREFGGFKPPPMFDD